MRKKWGKNLFQLKNHVMENKFGLTELTQNELMECNGGFLMSVIALFLATGKKALDLLEGIKEGYERATSTQQ